MYFISIFRLVSLITFSLFCSNSFAQSDTSGKELPTNALYLIDHRPSTKEAVEKLDRKLIESVDVLKGEKADKFIKTHNATGKTSVVLVTTTNFINEAVFTKVQNPASFPGGDKAWENYITTHLNYPETAKKNKTDGTVKLQIILNKDGSIREVRALNDPGDGLAAEATRLAKQSPKWIPAKQNGQNVTYRFVVPVVFKHKVIR